MNASRICSSICLISLIHIIGCGEKSYDCVLTKTCGANLTMQRSDSGTYGRLNADAGNGSIPMAMSSDQGADSSVSSDGGVTTHHDAGMTYDFCRPCPGLGQCESLGNDFSCTAIGNSGRYCSLRCNVNAPSCPPAFICSATNDHCVPANYDCTVCPGRPCDPGLVCDVSSGQCQPPRTVCESCRGNQTCESGLSCRALAGAEVCLPSCQDDGACPTGYQCSGLYCEPVSGRCDACGGRCQGITPACIDESGECGECNAETPCPDGQACDPVYNTCTRGEPCQCTNDAHCAINCDTRPICLQGTCVSCLDDSDCDPGSTCNLDTFTCDTTRCAGVTCQRGSDCDPATGRCESGCRTADDCLAPGLLDCNTNTGQCFYLDGQCDPDGQRGVCSPGSTCSLNSLTLTHTCSCQKVNPTAPFSVEFQIACQPGLLCYQLPDANQGFCIETPAE